MELKKGIEILVGQAVLSNRSKQSKCWFWINNSRTAWPTLILIPIFFFELHGQFPIRYTYYFEKMLIILR